MKDVMPMTRPTRTLLQIAEEVKRLHDRDEELGALRRSSKTEQRDVRLEVGQKVAHLTTEELSVVAGQSGYPAARLRDFAFVRKQWPAGSFPDDVGYTPLEELARDPERFDKVQPGMSKRDARAARGGKVDTPSRWSAETKGAFIAEALADPEVARQVAANVGATSALAQAEHAVYLEGRDRRDADQPGFKDMRQRNAGHDVVRRLIMARASVTHSLDQVMDEGIPQDMRQQIVAEVDRLRDAIGWFESYVTSGDRSFEQELQQLLKEQ